MPTRILLVDDHALIREGLALALVKVTEQVEVVEADSCEAALARIAETELDLIVLDMHLPGRRGLDALAAVRSAAPSTPVVVLSGEAPTDRVLAALAAGARGYLSKASSIDVLVGALRLVFAGGVYIPPTVLEPPPQHVPAVIDESALTPRQRRVLAELARDATTAEIAATLGIAEVTVRVHVATILRVLHVDSRAEAVQTPLARRLRDTLGR